MFDPMSPEVLLEAISLHGCRRAELALSTASVEQTGEWAAEGAVSFTGWLRRQARMSIGDARQLCAEGRWLSSFPAVAAAVVAGRISWSQVGIMMLAIRQPHRELFADHSPDLIEAFHPLDINDTIAAMKDWRDKADAILDIAPKEPLPNGWRVRELDEGGLAGHFVVGAEIANELLAALETARTTHADDVRSPAQRTADAAGAVFAFFNANHDRSGTPRHRPHVELIAHTYPELKQLIVDGAVRCPIRIVCSRRSQPAASPRSRARCCPTGLPTCTCATASSIGCSPPVPPSPTTAARRGPCRCICSAVWRCVMVGAGSPDCDQPVAWTDAHHIVHWRHHGRTGERNLLLLCGFHHRLVHRDHWDIVLHLDATATFTKVDGTSLVSRPRGPCRRGRPASAPMTSPSSATVGDDERHRRSTT